MPWGLASLGDDYCEKVAQCKADEFDSCTDFYYKQIVQAYMAGQMIAPSLLDRTVRGGRGGTESVRPHRTRQG